MDMASFYRPRVSHDVTTRRYFGRASIVDRSYLFHSVIVVKIYRYNNKGTQMCGSIYRTREEREKTVVCKVLLRIHLCTIRFSAVVTLEVHKEDSSFLIET